MIKNVQRKINRSKLLNVQYSGSVGIRFVIQDFKMISECSLAMHAIIVQNLKSCASSEEALKTTVMC